MPVTVSEKQTLAVVAERSNPNQIADILKAMNIGQMFNPVKITLAAIAAAAVVDITSFLKGVATLTINQGLATLDANQALPAILHVTTLRVTTSGTANSVGTYAIGDAGSTPVSPTAGANVGLATLSDDGKTLTFPTTVTGLVLEYKPRSATAFDTLLAPLPSGL